MGMSLFPSMANPGSAMVNTKQTGEEKNSKNPRLSRICDSLRWGIAETQERYGNTRRMFKRSVTPGRIAIVMVPLTWTCSMG